jgi:hypothetical protein
MFMSLAMVCTTLVTLAQTDLLLKRKTSMISQLKKMLKSRLRRFILSVMYDEVDRFVVLADQVRAYHTSSERERQRYYDDTRNPLALKERLIAAGVPVEDARIDIADFEEWQHDFQEIERFYNKWLEVRIEKCLEHYLAFKWLGISQKDLYVDIAAADSIWAELLGRRGIVAYRLDLNYPPGIKGCDIGADAGDTKLPAGFASAMSLQCAFETFRNDADIRFIHEARRVLNERGRLAILPLYTDETHFILSSPYVDLSGIQIDQGAIRVWREDSYKEPFSRHYSPEAFARRIYSQIEEMTGKIIHFTNLDELRARYSDQRIYCHFMFYCEK